MIVHISHPFSFHSWFLGREPSQHVSPQQTACGRIEGAEELPVSPGWRDEVGKVIKVIFLKGQFIAYW